MIQQLSIKYRNVTAGLMFTICFNGMILPTYGFGKLKSVPIPIYTNSEIRSNGEDSKTSFSDIEKNVSERTVPAKGDFKDKKNSNTPSKTLIGGPSQPEMSGFKSVGTDNMVNLFTGDFSYNIPLLDVGGYPVNIFYDGGVSMEQEASWVGLGWNINPGNVNRNVRGVPDDFDGSEVLTQVQTMKPNVTWGVNLGADLEVVGVKDIPVFSGSLGASLGVSFNNYLGPALDIGIRGNTGLSISAKGDAEKSAPRLGGSLSINASSRSGVTFSPGLSLAANAFTTGKGATGGFGLRASTSYNSRSGIKAIQISEQMSFNKTTVQERTGKADRYVKSGFGENLISTSISFTKPSYIPSMRMPLTNSAFSGHFQLGGALFGVYPSAEVEVYQQKSEVGPADVFQTKPMVGYLFMENASTNENAVMDFSRLNDNEVTPSTPIISAPQYAYDVFSIQGEGTGGSIRAYRNDNGYVRDNATASKDKNTSVGADIGIPGHYGANVNIIKTPSTISEWKDGNKLKNSTGFKSPNNSWENVYFRNPGENSVLNSDQYDNIGGTNLVRYKLGGSSTSPTIEPMLEEFSKDGKFFGNVNVTTAVSAERKKRSQVINFLTAEEASKIGLDKTIKSYDGNTILDNQGHLIYQSFPRYDNAERKQHHISQINVTEADGQRYIYGIPVYNLVQKDFTFSVANTEVLSDPNDPDKVAFSADETSSASPHIVSETHRDGYVLETITPAYSHSFLLSGLLSPDYVDVNNDGITEDDLGNAVKFNYTKIAGTSKWRTPLTTETVANFNAGKLSEPKDDKGLVSYGERESWYLHSIESKTMIALFRLEDRDDSKGSVDTVSGINNNDHSAQRLKQIDLYSKADLKKNGLQGAKPIKTVHFQYSYTLCKGTPNNTTGEGKLTLDKVYFTFNGQARTIKNQYVFDYGSTLADNPDYAFNASDRWGTYKPASANPSTVNRIDYPHDKFKNSDYPYSIQDQSQKTTLDQYASAWMLKKILLPSGGQLEVTYESDDYAFVQNKRAAEMMRVLGFGVDASHITNQLFTINGNSIDENYYVFISVPDACISAADVYPKYLSGMEQLSFKLSVNMPKGLEFLNSYATFDKDNCGLYTADATNKTIWIKLDPVHGKNPSDDISPLSLTAIEFLREQLPGQAYPGYDVSETQGLEQIGKILVGWFDGIKSAFSNPVNYLREKGKAQMVDVSKCFARLNNSYGVKYGGGYRVKSIRLKDNWKKMNNDQQFTSEYGQDYDYTIKENFNGIDRKISSGVASYEPSLGGDENPFQTMIQISNKVPLGPASYGAIEMPVLDAFFPAPSVGYSRVTVTSIKNGPQDLTQKTRSGIGKQVTEFYTAKDFPVYYNNTTLDPASDKQANSSSFGLFFYKYAFDSRALSQGFLVETNDMHGKLKLQASYAENDDKTPVNFTQNFYRNTGIKGFDEKFNFVYASQGGTIAEGNMGIDVELMTDTREFSVQSKSLEIQGQVDLFPIILPIWLPFIWPVVGESENIYRAVTTTKVVSYHSILDSVVIIDKGSQVSTKNLVYDAETGDVIVNRTNNEFNQPIYSTNYPAWWAYSGMGPAYQNIDAVYTGKNFYDGKITNMPDQNDIIESGDELYLADPPGSGTSGCISPSPDAIKLWAFDKNKNTTSLSVPLKDLVFLDAGGQLYTKSGVSFRIVRSGKRNMLNATAGSVVSMASPIVNGKLTIDGTSQVINASAVEFKEKWKTDNDVIRHLKTVTDPVTCVNTEVDDCMGYLEKHINPYLKGLLGTFRTNQSKVFYGDRKETNPSIATNIAANGHLDNFSLYWNFDNLNNLVPNPSTNSNWVWNTQTTAFNSRGLELETYNALKVYTAAQYGFNKTLPTAIANNSRYREMFSEGFEDADYDETLNNSLFSPCYKNHIDFMDMAGVNSYSVVNSDQVGINAHTGKKMLMIETNSQAAKIFDVSDDYNPDFNFALEADVTKVLDQPGGNSQFFNNSNYPFECLQYSNISFGSVNGLVFNAAPDDDYDNGIWRHSYTMDWSAYIEISQNALYVFDLSVTGYSGYHSQVQASTGFSVTFYDKEGIPIDTKSTGTQTGTSNPNSNYPASTNQFSLQLCPGIYYLVGSVYESYEDLSLQPHIPVLTSYTLKSNYQFPFYKSLNATGCNFTRPIPAENEMTNAIFNPIQEKKMQFSAWVRQDCPSSCNSDIQIWSGGQNIGIDQSLQPTIKKVGSIIEGWQKIEGDFTLPNNVSSAEIRFLNTNGATPMYVDDIRIHPYNANMKSYVYDPVNLRLVGELDENNYAKYYEYDDEGTLIRTKVETKEGVKTVTEIRSAKQKIISTPQP